ncbi:MAG: anthranilate phosphoribosyltransferase [Alphaproteobacteria bacterium]|nr:anthranilate phosphoribosyltransferase [Alphaproteobacteria bacterium]
MKDILLRLQRGEAFREEEMNALFSQIMEGGCSDAEIAAFLMGLSMRGETVDELTGAARVMRAKASGVSAPAGAVDCCGTGGDKSGTYNISTAVALVVAACGVPVAKHGNRASSSKSGAADVLEQLGVNLDASQDVLAQALERFSFAFLMAPKHHAAMKHVMPVRKALGVRTIFNLLGPLANPAGTKRQLIGVLDRKWLIPFAETLRRLGSESAWIVHGSDGLDEITTTGETFVAKLENGVIEETILSPGDFGLDVSRAEDLIGGDAALNAAALSDVLDGKRCAYRDIVLANAAAVLMISKDTNGLGVHTLRDSVALAAEAVNSGRARGVLDGYINFTKGVS